MLSSLEILGLNSSRFETQCSLESGKFLRGDRYISEVHNSEEGSRFGAFLSVFTYVLPYDGLLKRAPQSPLSSEVNKGSTLRVCPCLHAHRHSLYLIFVTNFAGHRFNKAEQGRGALRRLPDIALPDFVRLMLARNKDRYACSMTHILAASVVRFSAARGLVNGEGPSVCTAISIWFWGRGGGGGQTS